MIQGEHDSHHLDGYRQAEGAAAPLRKHRIAPQHGSVMPPPLVEGARPTCQTTPRCDASRMKHRGGLPLKKNFYRFQTLSVVPESSIGATA